jgi:membrane protease YdiL (CAAX protease family)
MIGAMLGERPAYLPNTPWGPIGALATVTAISLLCQYILPLCLYNAFSEVYAKASGDVGPPTLWGNSYSPSFVLLIQVAILGLIWLASGMHGGNRRAVLSLKFPVGGLARTVSIACLIWLLTVPTGFLVNEFFGHVAEPIHFRSVNFNEAWLHRFFPAIEFVSLVFVTPLMEEFIFRGFLLSAITRSKIGFAGAGLVTSALWASMHVSYPWHSLFMVFVVGLFLSWAIWKTGSLWTCVLAHGLYNLEPAVFQLIFLRT